MVKRKLNLSNISILLILIFIFLNDMTLADFIEPVVVVNGKIGEAINEFNVEHDDMGLSVPSIRTVNAKGNIFLVDKKGISIFNQKGNLLNIINAKNIENAEGWPVFMDADSQDNIYTSNYDNKLQKYNYKGEKIWEREITIGRIQVQYNNAIMLWGFRPDQKDKERNLLYSPAGQLLNTYKTQPLELGLINIDSTKNDITKVTVDYPEKKYSIEILKYNVEDKISRDIFQNLYVAQRRVNIIKQDMPDKDYVQHYIVNRIDNCTGDQIKLDMPENKYKVVGEDISVGKLKKPLELYGEPVISPNGDAYAWRYTPEKYSILKWTWQGPEDAPQSLQISAGLSGLKLNWMKPAKDVETVTGYQIFRSTEICGPFTEVTMVKKDKLTFEDQTIKPPWKYYYVVKAVRDKKVSGDSNKVYMQWK